MGLFAFNRMRLRRVEATKPENLPKEEETKEEVKAPEEPLPEEKEVKAEENAEPVVKRGSSRKK